MRYNTKKLYDEYFSKLNFKIRNEQSIKINEIKEKLNSQIWTEDLLQYCEQNNSIFSMRYGFIDLIDFDKYIERIKGASVKEIYTIRDVFKNIYRTSNIYDYFTNDKSKIIELRDEVISIKSNVTGINKPRALTSLVEYLDDIIIRLDKNNYI